ncbi:MAG: hypothetical protein NTX36_12495 [Proteobacteria bacterium]|nr:hypothetical protein [Pseudomonadota bacterium]
MRVVSRTHTRGRTSTKVDISERSIVVSRTHTRGRTDNKLYRKTHGTFEEYCKEKWNIERRRAYQLIDGYRISENVNARTQTEYQLRPLTKIKDPDQQREAFQKAVDTAPEGKVTARLFLVLAFRQE